MPVHNADIAAVFEEIAELLEIQGANPFRVRAYRIPTPRFDPVSLQSRPSPFATVLPIPQHSSKVALGRPLKRDMNAISGP